MLLRLIPLFHSAPHEYNSHAAALQHGRSRYTMPVSITLLILTTILNIHAAMSSGAALRSVTPGLGNTPGGPVVSDASKDALAAAAITTPTTSTATLTRTSAASFPSAGRLLLSGAAASAAPAVRLVIVNDIAGHFEVLAGVLTRVHVLMTQQQQHSQSQSPSSDLRIEPLPRVLYAGNARAPGENGLQDWLGGEVVGAFAWHALNPAVSGIDPTLVMPPPPPPGPGWHTPADVVICVSAELAPKVCKGVLEEVRPRLLVIVVHRADTHTPNARFLSLHPAFKLMALAPHVANLSSHMLRRSVDWSMPVAAYIPRRVCSARKCLRGFSIQGALRRFKSKHGNGFTRDYSGLWQRLLQLRSGGQEVPPIVVVGKGLRQDLLLPPELEDRVAFHPYLKYPDFWSLIHHSYALVPAFGMPVYYESRISSTILASLLTCVPVIAEQRLLDTYSFLDERHVFLRQPGEDEAAAMVRIMALPDDQIFARRQALCELQRAMNERADGMLAGYLRQSLELPLAVAAAAG